MSITKELFKTLIKEGQELISDVLLYDRPLQFEDNGRYVLVGIRQAGKSYMLFKRAKELIAKGHSLEEMVYINFDDERLLGMTSADFDDILQTYGSMYQNKPILFFDEIQNISGWEHFARRLANLKYQVYITGSNAKMLSNDIQTTLGGRYLSETIFPYSFREYIESQGEKLSENWQYGKQSLAVQRAFAEYFKWGGFPELSLFSNKRHWLNDLYEKILLGDIILRNKIKNTIGMRLTMKRLAENVKQPTSYNRLANLINATGVKTTAASVIDYVRFAKESYIIFSLDNYASKFVEKETAKKHYFIDNGILSIFINNDETSLLENLCAIHLFKQYGSDVYFWNKNIEVDFVIPNEALAIQVSYSIADEITRKREVDALIKLNSHTPLKQMIIVTYDEETTIETPKGTISVVPAWKWILSLC